MQDTATVTEPIHRQRVVQDRDSARAANAATGAYAVVLLAFARALA